MNANKQDAGGLLPDELEAAIQDVADHANSDGDFVSNETERATENLRMKIRAYGELCRAAPAGGDRDPLPTHHCQNGRSDICLAANYDGVCCPDDSCDIDDGVRDPRPDSAPAGSGEDMAKCLEAIAEVREPLHGWHRGTLHKAAALLRKLQQGADGWIAASERLPERIEGTAHSAEVLVSDGKRVWIHCAYFDWKACERDYWGDTPYVPRLGSGATHWRPLPHASQGQEGE